MKQVYLKHKNIGNIIDLNIDEQGKTVDLIVEKRKFFISFFSNKKEISVKWEQINKIGEDVILVNIEY